MYIYLLHREGMKKLFFIMLVVPFLLSCVGKGNGRPMQERHFKMVEIPAIMKDKGEIRSYVGEHYWDSFFDGDGPTDTGRVLGVAKDEIHKALATYLEIVLPMPLEEGRRDIEILFDRMERKQAEDSSSHIYMLLTEMVADYLYDPNSPYRDEDLYLPFVRRMLASPFTQDNLKDGYGYEERMCSLNGRETVAADFVFRDSNGRNGSLHGINSDYVLLFFSNPGCSACGEIEKGLENSDAVSYLQESGRLKVLDIYIDRELEKWREYVPHYPSAWISAFDCKFVIREDSIYNVRAIPSLYLLGPGKKVIYKDAPLERVLAYMERIKQQILC